MGKRIQSNHRFTTLHLCRTHLALALTSLCPAGASAGISTTGDVSPDPATTTLSDPLVIGDSADGTAVVDAGSTIQSESGTLGNQSGVTGTATIDGARSSWDAMYDVVLGNYGTGDLYVLDGGDFTARNLQLGTREASSGSLTIDGLGSTVQLDDSLRAGLLGEALVWVQNGATLQSSGGSIGNSIFPGPERGTLYDAEVHVDGIGSTWQMTGGVSVAYEGSGALTITNGGVVTTGTRAWVGQQQLSVGEVTVSGAGSRWDITEELGLGSSGQATVHVLSGGVITSGRVSVGYNAIGEADVLVQGAGSRWEIAGGLRYEEGLLQLLDGGVITITEEAYFERADQDEGLRLKVSGLDTRLEIEGLARFGVDTELSQGGYVHSVGGAQVGGGSTLSISGSDSHWKAEGGIDIDFAGFGVIDQSSGLVEVVGGMLEVGSVVEETSSLTLDPTDSTVSPLFTPGPNYDDATYNLAGGTLDLTGNDIVLGSGPDIEFNFTNGRLQNVGNFVGDLTQQGGTLAPGNSPGQLTIQGNYTLEQGTLEIELDGSTTPGVDYDQLSVIGEVDLIGADALADGQLDLSLGFAASIGDSFTILDNDGSDAITGAFAQGSSLSAMYAGAEYLFGIDYAGGTGNDIVLTVSDVILSLLMGDADGDGDVDAFDITAVEQNFGTTGDPGGTLLGDADGDGDVDAFDITAVEQNFGNTSPAPVSLSAAAIPEPSSLVLLGVGGLLLTRRRRGA